MIIPHPARPVNPRIDRRAGRFAAVLSAACVLGHIPMLVGHVTEHPKTTLLMVAVAALCVFCIRKLWTVPNRQDIQVAGCLAAAMLGVHLFLMLSMAGGPALEHGAAHQHGASTIEVAEMPGGHSHGTLFDGFFYLSTALATAQIAFCIAVAVRSRPRFG